MEPSPWRFDPWVSKGQFRGVNLLLVGESHYDENPECLDRNHTIQVVEDYGVGDHPCRTRLFRNAYAAFTGDFDLGVRGGKATFWKNVSFCNYFQRPMSVSDEQPTEEDYESSRTPFDALLRHVAPDCFVVMSDRLWRGMKNNCRRMASIGPVNGDDVFGFAMDPRVVPA